MKTLAIILAHGTGSDASLSDTIGAFFSIGLLVAAIVLAVAGIAGFSK